MTSSTNFSGPVKVQGRYVATLSADGSSLVDGAGNSVAVFKNASPIFGGSAYAETSYMLRQLRREWERRCARLRRRNPPQPNIGTVVYVDPTSPTNGAGTLSSPRNNYPALTGNQTILLKEGTTGEPVILGAATGWLLGTYDAKSGARVFDPARIATIDGLGGTAINLSGNQVNTWISGIRVTNFLFGVVKGQASGASGGGIEYCVAASQVPNVMTTCFQSLVGGSTIRFNTVDGVLGDGIWYGQNTNTSATGVQIYGNDIRLDESGLVIDGPDCVQLSSNNGEAVGAYVVHTNWMENRQNRKQIVIATYNNTLTATDSFTCFHNVCIGADTSLPKAGGNSQNGIYSEIPNSKIYGNYVENSRYPIVVTSGNPTFVNGAQIYGNLIVVNMRGVLRAAIEASSTAASGVPTVICNNTIVGIACGGSDNPPVLPAISSLGPAYIRNNIIIGTFWVRPLQVNVSNASGVFHERGNVFDSRLTSPVFDSGTGAKTPDATDIIGAENLVDSYYQPLVGGPLERSGTPCVEVIEDVLGKLPRGATNWIGSRIPAPDVVNEWEEIPLLSGVSENWTGPWVPAGRTRKMTSRFSITASGTGDVTLTVQGKLDGQADASATTLATVLLGATAAITSKVDAAIDAGSKDLVRVVVSGYNGHGTINAAIAA